VAEMAFPADMASVVLSAVRVSLVEVHLCLYAFSISGDQVLGNFGKKGSRLFDFHDA